MNGEELSKSVADAARFLREVHTDTRALLVSIEAVMVSAGWKPIAKKLTEPQPKATLQDEWMLWWFYRMYIPSNSDGNFTRLILISGGFGAEPGGFAAFTAGAIRFSQATTFSEVWDNWESTDGVRSAARKHTGVVRLNNSDFAEYAPFASAVAAITFPLCALGSEGAVRAQLVEPLLAAEAKLGAPV